MKKLFFALYNLVLGLQTQAVTEQQGKLFIVYGPSGAGKTTLIREAMCTLAIECPLHPVVTYTTRAPRPGEQEGVDYHFITMEQFKEKKDNNLFIHTTQMLTASYGLASSIVQELKNGKSYIVSLDHHGARALKKSIENTVLLWIDAPLDELKLRMNKRNGDTPEQIAKRFALAEQEIKQERARNEYNYRIFNDNLEAAHAHMTQVIKTELKK